MSASQASTTVSIAPSTAKPLPAGVVGERSRAPTVGDIPAGFVMGAKGRLIKVGGPAYLKLHPEEKPKREQGFISEEKRNVLIGRLTAAFTDFKDQDPEVVNDVKSVIDELKVEMNKPYKLPIYNKLATNIAQLETLTKAEAINLEDIQDRLAKLAVAVSP
jgi:hypothetical protein